MGKCFQSPVLRPSVIPLLLSHISIFSSLFAINAAGEVYIVAPPEDLLEDTYGLLITALDDGYPPRQSSGLLTVKFPPSGVVRTTQTAAVRTKEEDDMLPIILGAVAGVLLVVILIMAVYIIWK